MSSPKCGCRVEFGTEGIIPVIWMSKQVSRLHPFIVHCPLHAAAEEMRAMLAEVCDRWTFNDDQKFTHNWHDWADVVPKIKTLLKSTN